MTTRRAHYRINSSTGERHLVREHSVSGGPDPAAVAVLDHAELATLAAAVEEDPFPTVTPVEPGAWPQRSHETYLRSLEADAAVQHGQLAEARAADQHAVAEQLARCERDLQSHADAQAAADQADKAATDAAQANFRASLDQAGYEDALRRHLAERGLDSGPDFDHLMRVRTHGTEMPFSAEVLARRAADPTEPPLRAPRVRGPETSPRYSYSEEMASMQLQAYTSCIDDNVRSALATRAAAHSHATSLAADAKNAEQAIAGLRRQQLHGADPSPATRTAMWAAQAADRRVQDAKSAHAAGLPSDATVVRNGNDGHAIKQMRSYPDGTTNVRVATSDGIKKVVGYGVQRGDHQSSATLELEGGTRIASQTSYATGARATSGMGPGTIFVLKPRPDAMPATRSDGGPVEVLDVNVDAGS